MSLAKPSAKTIGVFVLAMINVVAIASLRGLPAMAEYGLASAFFFILAALIFFIPTALVSAELATGWPKRGGVFVWVKEALGERWGFLAIWLQWIQNVVWYPTVLSFTAATLAYIFNPSLANNPLYMLAVIVTVYWGATFVDLKGMKLSGKISTIGGLAGTIIPGALIILLGAIWVFGGNPLQIPVSIESFIPDFSNIQNIALAAGVLLSVAGMEMSAVHAQEVKNPQRDYPKAIFLSTIVILTVFILGTLAIAAVVPQAKISLVAGIMEAFTAFFAAYGISWLVPIIAFLITVGAATQVTTWIAGPSRGLLETAKEGELPPFFQKVNKAGMPTNLLYAQGAIVTGLALVFLLMPNVSSSYWILTALTAQIYLLMYVLLFASAIKLRYSQPNVKRAFLVPGGNAGMWLVAGMGLLASLFGILLGYFPPAQLETGNIMVFEAFLLGGMALLAGAPLLIHHFREPSWLPGKAKSKKRR